MTKVSGYAEADLDIVIELVADGQRLNLRVGPGNTRHKVRFEIGHIHGYGELFVERFETADPSDELDLRVKLVLPSGAGDRPTSAGEVLPGTFAAGARADARQRSQSAALPKDVTDGQPFVTGADAPGALAVLAGEPGAPSAAEIANTPPGADGAQVAGAEPEIDVLTHDRDPLAALSVIATDRQFTAPTPNEEEELSKIVRTSLTPTVTDLPEPSAEQIAELISTTSPRPNEERELAEKQRGGRRSGAAPLGGRLR